MLQELYLFFSVTVHWTVLSGRQKMNRSILTSSRSQWLKLAKRWFLAVGDVFLLCFSKAERIWKVKVDPTLCIRRVNRSNEESFNLEKMLKRMTCNKTLLVNAKEKKKYIFKHRSCDLKAQNIVNLPLKQKQQKNEIQTFSH